MVGWCSHVPGLHHHSPEYSQIVSYFMTQGGFTPIMWGSKQTMAWHQFTQQICFALSSLEETDVKGVDLANCSGKKPKRHRSLRAAKWNSIPHPHHKCHDELADLTVLTQATQLGKCQEHLLWGQHVHLMKTGRIIFCTLIMFQVSKRLHSKLSDLPSWQKIMVRAISEWWNCR